MANTHLDPTREYNRDHPDKCYWIWDKTDNVYIKDADGLEYQFGDYHEAWKFMDEMPKIEGHQYYVRNVA